MELSIFHNINIYYGPYDSVEIKFSLELAKSIDINDLHDISGAVINFFLLWLLASKIDSQGPLFDA